MAMRRSRSRTTRETPRAAAPTAPTEDDRRAIGGEEQASDCADRSRELRERVRDIHRRFEAGFKDLAER